MPYDENGNYYDSDPFKPLFDEDKDDTLTATSSVMPKDLPKFYRKGSAGVDAQTATNHKIIRQAVLSGKIPPEEGANMISGDVDNRNIVEKIMGLERNGMDSDILMPIVDVMSTFGYMNSAFAGARAEGIARETHRARQAGEIDQEDTLPWYNYTRWSPTAIPEGEFKRNWERRTMYGDVFGEDYNLIGFDEDGWSASSWKNLALDIALDPLTWTGIGLAGKVVKVSGLGKEVAEQFVAKGAKATAAKAVGKEVPDIAAKMASPEGAAVKSTAWGERMLRATRQILEKEMVEELAEEGAKAGSRSPWQSQIMAETIKQRAPREMIERYDEIASAVWKRDTFSRRTAKNLAGKSQAGINHFAKKHGLNELDMLKPPPPSAMFQETAGLWRREFGIPIGSAVTKGMAAIANNRFTPDWNWVKRANMDPELKQAWVSIRDSTKQSTKEWERGIREYFTDFSIEEQRTITEILESKGKAGKSARNVAPVLDNQYDEKLTNAALWAEKAFADIAEEEIKYNILNETLEGYVTHLFNGNPKTINNFMEVLRKRGMDMSLLSEKGSKFSLHRYIASIDDMRNIYGDDFVLSEIGEILFRRKRMSLEMLARKKFLLGVQATDGYGGLLIESAKSGVPRSVRTAMVDRRATPWEISELDQFWTREEINLSKWGLNRGVDGSEHIAGNANRNVLRWLTSNSTTRKSIDAYAAETKGVKATDTLRTYKGRINPKVGFQDQGAKYTVDINEYLEALASKTNSPARSNIVDKVGFEKWEDIPLRVHKRILTEFDKRLKKDVGPLIEVMPELQNIFSPTAKRAASWARTIPGSQPKSLKSLLAKLNEPVSEKLVPGLNDALALSTIALRRKMGDVTDTAKPSEKVLSAIGDSLKVLGVTPSQLTELIKTAFNKNSLGSLNAREADILDMHIGLTRLSTLKGPKKAEYLSRYRSIVGENLVEVKIPTVLGRRPSIIKTNVDDIVSTSSKAREGSKKAISTAEATHKNDVSVFNAYKSKARELSSLFNKISGVKKRLAKLDPERNTVAYSRRADELVDLEEQRDKLIAKHGTGEQLQKKIKKAKASIDSSVAAGKKAKALDAFEKDRSAWLKLEDNALKYPDSKEAVSAAKKKKASLIKRAKKLGVEIGDSPRVVSTELPQKLLKDPRTAGDEFIGGFERPVTKDGKLVIERSPGTVGPQITAPGEFVDNFRYASYYLPESVAALFDDINSSLYHDGPFRKIATLMRGYDMFTAYFKARVMAPFLDFHKRNGVTDVAIATLRSGLGLFHPGHWRDYSNVMVYNLNKDLVDVKHLTLSGGTSGAVMGAEVGGIAGASAGFIEGEGFSDTASKMMTGAMTGGAAGARGGAGIGLAGGAVVGAGLRKAAKSRGNVDKLGQQTIKSSTGVEYTVAEFTEEMAKRGVFNTQVQTEILEETGSMLHTMAKSAGKKVPAGVSHSTKMKQTIFMEDVFRAGELATTIPIRTMLFTQIWKESGNLGLAARETKKWLYDYSNLNMFERRILRRFIPFYTWSKHALGVNYDGILKNPGLYSGQLKPFVGMAKDDGVDPADYPDWLSDRLSRFSVAYHPVTGEREVQVKQGYGLVQEELLGQWKDIQGLFSGDEPSRILARGPFGATSVLESWANYDTFRQGYIKNTMENRSAYESGKEWENSPDWLKSAVGYTTDSKGKPKVDPRASWMLRELQPTRVYGIAKQVMELDDEGRSRVNWIAMARAMLGEKMYTYGPEQRLYHDRARLERVAQWLSKMHLTKPVTIQVPVDSVPKRKKRKLKKLSDY